MSISSLRPERSASANSATPARSVQALYRREVLYLKWSFCQMKGDTLNINYKRSAILKLCLNLSTQMSLRYMRIFNAFAIFFQKTHTFSSSSHKKTKKVFKIRENLSNP